MPGGKKKLFRNAESKPGKPGSRLDKFAVSAQFDEAYSKTGVPWYPLR